MSQPATSEIVDVARRAAVLIRDQYRRGELSDAALAETIATAVATAYEAGSKDAKPVICLRCAREERTADRAPGAGEVRF